MIARLLWRLFNPLQVVTLVLWSALCIVIAMMLAIVTRGSRLSMAMADRIWAPVACRFFLARVELRGAEHLPTAGPRVFVSNHRSNFDVVALFAALRQPLRFLAKEELRKVPFLGWYIGAMGMIFVDRSSRASARESLRRGAELLGEGHALLSFPEATRNQGEELLPFKRGIFGLAASANATLVPVAIDGSSRIWPPGGLALRPGTVTVTLGEPIVDPDASSEELSNRAREAIGRLLPGSEPDEEAGQEAAGAGLSRR